MHIKISTFSLTFSESICQVFDILKIGRKAVPNKKNIVFIHTINFYHTIYGKILYTHNSVYKGFLHLIINRRNNYCLMAVFLILIFMGFLVLRLFSVIKKQIFMSELKEAKNNQKIINNNN